MRAPRAVAMAPGNEPAGRRWLMWGLPTLLFFVAFLHRPAPGVLAKDLMVNMGGFLGAALIQGPLGAVLDAGWAGVVVAGARVYPVGAYRAAFALCAAFALATALVSLLVRETRGQNAHGRLVGAAGAHPPGTERPA